MEDLSRELIVEFTRKLDKLCMTMETVRERQDEMIENVSKIKEAVYNPDEGLYARIRALESWKDTSSKVTWTLFTAVIGLASALVDTLLAASVAFALQWECDGGSARPSGLPLSAGSRKLTREWLPPEPAPSR